MLVDGFQRGRFSIVLEVDFWRVLPAGVVEPARTGVDELDVLDSVESLEVGRRRAVGASVELPLRADES
jgi:hypothetical protein